MRTIPASCLWCMSAISRIWASVTYARGLPIGAYMVPVFRSLAHSLRTCLVEMPRSLAASEAGTPLLSFFAKYCLDSSVSLLGTVFRDRYSLK